MSCCVNDEQTCSAQLPRHCHHSRHCIQQICCCCYTRMFTVCCWSLFDADAGAGACTFNGCAAVFLLPQSFCSHKHKVHISKQAKFCSSRRRCSYSIMQKRADMCVYSGVLFLFLLLVAKIATEPGNCAFIVPAVVVGACVVNVFFGGRNL